MGEDWKKRAEEISQEKYLREEQKREAKREAEQRKERAAYERKLAFHQARFHCVVCGKPSSGPAIVRGAISQGTGQQYYDTKWEAPSDLTQCNLCKKYACEEHIHNRVCQSCALNPVRRRFFELFKH